MIFQKLMVVLSCLSVIYGQVLTVNCSDRDRCAAVIKTLNEANKRIIANCNVKDPNTRSVLVTQQSILAGLSTRSAMMHVG